MTNNVLADAICGLATAIRLLDINKLSSEAAARVEEIIHAARLEESRTLEEMRSSWAATRTFTKLESRSAADGLKHAPSRPAVEIEPGS